MVRFEILKLHTNQGNNLDGHTMKKTLKTKPNDLGIKPPTPVIHKYQNITITRDKMTKHIKF